MLLSAIAIAAAWTIFRFNADAGLKHTLTAAKARLLAVKEGVIDGGGGQLHAFAVPGLARRLQRLAQRSKKSGFQGE